MPQSGGAAIDWIRRQQGQETHAEKNAAASCPISEPPAHGLKGFGPVTDEGAGFNFVRSRQKRFAGAGCCRLEQGPQLARPPPGLTFEMVRQGVVREHGTVAPCHYASDNSPAKGQNPCHQHPVRRVEPAEQGQPGGNPECEHHRADSGRGPRQSPQLPERRAKQSQRRLGGTRTHPPYPTA